MAENFDPTKLLEMRLSPGKLFWIKRSGGRVLLANPGDAIDHELVDKFIKRGVVFDLENFINAQRVNKGVELFKKLKESVFEYQRVDAAQEIIVFFNDWLWEQKEEASLVDLIVIGDRTFYSIYPKCEIELKDASLDIFKRSFLVGSLNMVFALVLGIYDFKDLQDIYHAAFFYDYALLKETLVKSDVIALSEARTKGRELSGIFVNQEREKLFIDHPIRSVKEIKNIEKDIFHGNIHRRLILIHEELVNGIGFPKGVNGRELSDLEKSIIFTNQIVSFDQIKFSNNDAAAYLKNIMSSPDLDARIRRLVENRFNSFASQEAG